MEALRARVGELERELALARTGQVRTGVLALNLLQHTAEVEGRAIRLLPREFILLVALAGRAGSAVSRADLLLAIAKDRAKPKSNVIPVQISRLRSKLRGSGVSIETERGVGYRLVMRT